MKRRDITLGEMQDECKRVNGVCVGLAFVTEDCKYKEVCPFQMQSRKALGWDLSDPPRFTEAQMAGISGLYAIGVRLIEVQSGIFMMWKSTEKEHVSFIGTMVSKAFGLENVTNETLDLAELLGKDKE